MEFLLVVGYIGLSGFMKEFVVMVRKNYEEMLEIFELILNLMGRFVEKVREVIIFDFDRELKF